MNFYNFQNSKVTTILFYSFGYAFLVMTLLLFIQPIGLIKLGWVKRKIWLILLLGINYGFFYFIKTLSLRFIFDNRLIKGYQIILFEIFFILLISIVNIFIIVLLFPQNNNVDITNTFLASIAITTISHLVYKIISKQLFIRSNHSADKKNEGTEIFSIKDNNTVISIPVKNIYYIKSVGNYIEIIEKNNKRRHLIRYSLKNLDNKYTDLYRCHKSYLVNIPHITKITGNTKGYKLELKDLPGVTIPVSRTKGKKIINQLAQE